MHNKIENLNIDEKIKLLIGTESWALYDAGGKLTKCVLFDGPCGLRYPNPEGSKEQFKPAIAHPSISVIANSWSREIAELVGKTIADECIENDVDLLLAPGINIKRTPTNGRNFEYFSEDPYLAGELAKSYIYGLQKKGVAACIKHFMANNREFMRFGMSSEIDERTMRELYLRVFEIALEAKPLALMTSYNLLNGVYTSENKKLITDILKKEFQYKGVVFSDWNAVNHVVKSVQAGLDIQEPFKETTFPTLKSAYESGELKESDIDRAVSNILDFLDKVEENKKIRKVEMTELQRYKNAVIEAEEGIVLLKNQDNILPLKKDSSVCILGMIQEGYCFGGGGSSEVNPIKPLKTLETAMKESGFYSDIIYHPAYQNQLGKYCMHVLGCSMEMAFEKEFCILDVGNLPQEEGENFDRDTLKLNSIIEFTINETYKVNKNLIVIINAGSAIDMTAWQDKAKAIIFAGYAGQGVNEALTNIITGKVCPSGKLAETFPFRVEDIPTYPFEENASVDRYREGLMVGYRYYDTVNKDVEYPFGFGLSYANFIYSDLVVNKQENNEYDISFKITNISDVDGKEVSQLYIRDVNSYVYRPLKELKKFSKDFIRAGESKIVKFHLDKKDFCFWSTVYDEWTLEDGNFEILIGSSSRDIRLKKSLLIGKYFVRY